MKLRLPVLLALLPGLVWGPVGHAQSPLGPPALPPNLPGGGALPNLPAGTQQEILQRLLDAGSGRSLGGTAPAPAMPAPPPPPAAPGPGAGPTGPAPGEESLSPVEQFFAARLPSPLRQFGYESFRNATPGNATGVGFGAVPEDYVIGRDDELVLSFRGR